MLTTTSLDQSHELASNSPEDPQTAPKPGSSTKDNLKATGRCIRTLAKKLPGIVDTNPVKVVLGLVKLIIEIQQAVAENIDTVKQKLDATQARLEAVEEELGDWTPMTAQESQFIDSFKRTLEEGLIELKELGDEWWGRKVADHEAEKGRIMGIFERINEARVRFELAVNIRVFKSVYDIAEAFRKHLLEGLKPSSLADHKYDLENKEEKLVLREACTPGTRVRILDDIITWATDTSPGSPNVYWLFGQGGSGKSTIAYSVARRFEFAGDPNNTIILGGSFFCSQQFEETRLSKWIIRTVAYNLALNCRAFADQLKHANFGTVNQNVHTQLNCLLIAPWQASKADRCPDPLNPPPHYLIVIDAPDEIDEPGRSNFLRALLGVIDKNENPLQGLKFFVTSRSDPDLVKQVKSLQSKQLYHLEDVPPEEAQHDIRLYLAAELPHFAECEEFENLVALSAGLFIYAATIAKHLVKYQPSEQKDFLTTFLASSNSSNLQLLSTGEPFTRLDRLYSQILDGAFRDFSPKEKAWEVRRRILHTFLCTAERTSTSVVADLLFTSEDVAQNLLSNLHAVLYCGKDDQVLIHHKSFSDFIFDQGRSDNFWCNQAMHHRDLANACFRYMKDGLCFNIAEIPSSFVLDVVDPMLEDAVKKNIPPVLDYSCRNWSYHLSAVAPIIQDNLHNSISDFLQLHALFWIEAMNLLHSRGLCGSMLQTAHDWVISSQDPESLAEKLAEARSFALYFSGSGASSSTPHLYISALATWPRNLDPCRRWKSHFPRIPGFINASLGGTLLMTLNLPSSVTAVAVSLSGKRIVSGSKDKLVRVWDASTGDELKMLKGHADWVESVAFSPDGKQIVSGSKDKSVRLWDASTGDELNVFKHKYPVTSVSFSPDGKQIVSGSDDTSVRVWDALMGDKSNELKGATSVAFLPDGEQIVSGSYDEWVWDGLTDDVSITSVAFSPDGEQIASGWDDHLVRVWNVETGNKLELKGHTNSVTSVAFSLDGKQIVSGSYDESVRVWNAATSDNLELKGHTHVVTSVAFSPDGTQIVSGSKDKSVRVWDLSTGNGLDDASKLFHTESVTSVAFSPDGKQIVSGSYDRSVRVWNVATGDKLELKGHTNSVTSVAFSPDGKQIVSGSYDESVRVWNVATGDNLELNGHTHVVTSVAFSPDGTQIVSGSDDKSVQVWDVSTGYKLKVLKGHAFSVTSVAFLLDGKQIVSGSKDKSVRVWDVSTGNELKESKGHTNLVISVAFSPDGKQIISGSVDKSVRVWNASTGDELKVLKGHTNSVRSVAFSPDGKWIVSGSDDRSVRVWDVLTGNKLMVLKGHTNSVISVAFLPDGKQIVSGSKDKSVGVWDLLTRKLKVLMGHSNFVRLVAFSPDAKQIVSFSSDAKQIVSGSDNKVLKGHTDSVTLVAFSPDAKQIVSCSDDSVGVWDVSTGKLKVLKGIINLVISVAFSRDGKHIVLGSDDNTAWVWDASTGDELKVLEGHADFVTSVAFSPDGKQIVSGSNDKSVRVWDVSTGDVLKVLKGHTDSVISVAFSPDGTQIVSGSNDESVRVWYAPTGDELKELKGHTNLIRSVAFSPDGNQLVSGSGDNSAWVWDVGSLHIREMTSDYNQHEKHTGWLLSLDDQHRLMFVPPELLLPDASNIFTIPRSSCSYVDLAHSALGPQWEQCHDPMYIPEGLHGHQLEENIHPRQVFFLETVNIILWILVTLLQIHFWYTRVSTAGISIPAMFLFAVSLLLNYVVLDLYNGHGKNWSVLRWCWRFMIAIPIHITLPLVMVKVVTRVEVRWWGYMPLVWFAPMTRRE